MDIFYIFPHFLFLFIVLCVAYDLWIINSEWYQMCVDFLVSIQIYNLYQC